MERNIKILPFDKFLEEQESPGVTGASPEGPKPETDQEAKSRIALNIVKGIFGDVEGLTGGIDSMIEQTPEVKDSLPYRGCGTNEPFKSEKTPLSVRTIKILLKYLQEAGKGDYTRALVELKEKRAIVLGVRNKIDIKKESANQDRFCDLLYYIPGNANDGSEDSGAPTATKAEPKKEEGVFGRLGKNKKNESLTDIIEKSIEELESMTESGVWSFDDFENINNEKLFLLGNRDLLESGKIKDEDFVNLYEQTKNKNKTSQTVQSAPAEPLSLGDIINPYQITTVASLAYYGKKPMNPKGVGIKLPGDTSYLLQEASLGGKQKYKMMVEAQPIKVGRYPIGVTKYETYKPADVYTENCGMHIHRSSTAGVGICVGPWSAGCQVFADNNEWKEFISKAEAEAMNGGKFIYALIQLDDIPKNVFDSALKGISASHSEEDQIASVDEPKKKDKPGGLKNFGRITED